MCHDLKVHECDCPCHKNQDMKHCMACCEECPHCHKNIKRAFIADHKKVCQGTPTQNIAREDYPPQSLVFEVDDLDLAP